ncbi:hypothetical protein [uncultured Sulfitobacter sp.]|nr:hypothetical protein [uncultured Sulfitobacter sp.]
MKSIWGDHLDGPAQLAAYRAPASDDPDVHHLTNCRAVRAFQRTYQAD